jgi:hypothetical protein
VYFGDSVHLLGIGPFRIMCGCVRKVNGIDGKAVVNCRKQAVTAGNEFIKPKRDSMHTRTNN